MIVRESISFTRGNDPKNVLGIGQRYLIEKWLDEMDIEKYIINDEFFKCFIFVIGFGNRFYNRFDNMFIIYFVIDFIYLYIFNCFIFISFN